MKTQIDILDLLNLPKDYTKEELKLSYRKACLLYHPDRNKGVQHPLFNTIKEAYEKLSKQTTSPTSPPKSSKKNINLVSRLDLIKSGKDYVVKFYSNNIIKVESLGHYWTVSASEGFKKLYLRNDIVKESDYKLKLTFVAADGVKKSVVINVEKPLTTRIIEKLGSATGSILNTLRWWKK